MEAIAAKTTNSDLFDQATQLAADIASRQASLLTIVGELDRRQAFRDEGATSVEAWLTERLGMSEATARHYARLADRLYELPFLADALQSGELTFDKARAASTLFSEHQSHSPSPSTSLSLSLSNSPASSLSPDTALIDQARQCTVRQLTDMARASRGTTDSAALESHERRYLRCNDAKRTITAQFPADAYAAVRSAITREADKLKSDGETPFDQRMCDALVRLCRRITAPRSDHGDHVLVIAHADLSILRGGAGRAELERHGLLSTEAARRLACDADIALAIDDAFGHTMAEGRAVRFPTAPQRREVWRRDRHCRFPGCSNSLFTNVHHIVHWADGGSTDLSNLVLLCNHHHHHHTVHEGRWSMSGNANGVLRFTGPTKRLMTSRPSPLWTRRN